MIHADVDSPLPDIVENYHEFEAPANFKRMVRDLLKDVPKEYLTGLRTIVLTNQVALARDKRRQKIWSRRRKYRLAESRGLYYAATQSAPATVWLFVDNILSNQPSWICRAPLLGYDALAATLYHEIGHHIHAVCRPAHKEREDVADEWARKLD